MNRKAEIEIAAIGDFDTNEYEKLGFIRGAQWADKTMIEKACKWLEDAIFKSTWESSTEFIENFRKAMEE